MRRRIRWLMNSEITTECDACGRPVDLVTGGACARCKKALCFAHLHGSWVRRLMVDFGAAPICVACRHAA